LEQLFGPVLGLRRDLYGRFDMTMFARHERFLLSEQERNENSVPPTTNERQEESALGGWKKF